MSFQFVDNNIGIDAAARLKIRSHAARGKNAGKKIARPSRRNIVTGPGYQRVLAVPSDRIMAGKITVDGTDMDVMFNTVPRHIADDLIVSAIPADKALQSRPTIHTTISFFSRIEYTPQLRTAFQGLDPSKGPQSMWTKMIFADEAYFHIAMASAMIPLRNLLVQKPDIIDALRHLSQTLRLLEQRLSGTDAVRDVNIATVIMMAQFERHQDHYPEAKAHLDGLRRMVELRGGIAQLMRDNPVLSHKIVRFDLEIAIYLGTPTIFTIQDHIHDTKTLNWLQTHHKQSYRDDPSALGCHHPNLSRALGDLATQATVLCRLLNDSAAGRREPLNAYYFHEVFVLLGSRLVELYPLGRTRPASALEDLVHLVLLALLMPFMHRLDGKISEMPMLENLLKNAMDSYVGGCGGRREEYSVVLWGALITSMLFSTRAGECAWLLEMMKVLLDTLSLRSWEETVELMRPFPWIDVMFGPVGKVLFLKAVYHRRGTQSN